MVNHPLSYRSVLDLKLVQDEYVSKYSKEKKHTPGTIKSYLLSLTHFMNFLKRSIERPDADNIVIVIDTDKFPTEKLLVLESEVSKWRESLRGETNQRQIEKMYEDGEGVLSIDDFRRALKSEQNSEGLWAS